MRTRAKYIQYLDKAFDYGEIFSIIPYDDPEEFYIKCRDDSINYVIMSEEPSSDIISEITSLDICLDDDESVDTVPNWLYKIKNLSALILPICFLKDEVFLHSDIFSNLKSLSIASMIGGENERFVLDCKIIQDIEYLRILPETVELVNTHELTKIRYFCANLGKAKKNYLEQLKFLPYLDYLVLNQVQKKVSTSILSNTQLTCLDITHYRPTNDILQVINPIKLKYLRINRYNQKINAQHLLHYVELEEVRFISSLIDNAEDLLSIKSLKNIDILDYKKSISQDVIAKMYTSNFLEEVDIS